MTSLKGFAVFNSRGRPIRSYRVLPSGSERSRKLWEHAVFLGMWSTTVVTFCLPMSIIWTTCSIWPLVEFAHSSVSNVPLVPAPRTV